MGLFNYLKKKLNVNELENANKDLVNTCNNISVRLNNLSNSIDFIKIDVEGLKNKQSSTTVINPDTNPEVDSIKNEISNINNRLNRIESDINSIVNSLKNDTDSLKNDIDSVIDSLKNDINSLKEAEKRIGFVDGNNNIFIDTTSLPSGTYTIKYIDKDNKSLDNCTEISKFTVK